jgi:uncharacterized protein
MPAEAKTIDAAGLAERERVLRILREHEAEIRAHGVTRLRMFGSMARGEAGPESDVDLLADIDRRAKFSLIELVGLQYFLDDLLGRETQVGTSLENARPRIRQRIEADALEVF